MRITNVLAATLCLPVLIGTAHSANLVTNGSFETGLTGWNSSGTQQAYAPSVVVTDGSTGCCFGEAAPASNIVGGSPDAAGTHGVYFVDDRADQILGQSVFLTAGNYFVGFDAYAPMNGFGNPGDASFSGTIAGISLANYTVKTQNTPQVWFNYSGLANVLTNGNYDVTFQFKTSGGHSADIVIDRVFITATEVRGGTSIEAVAVPEPGSFALLGLGLAGLSAMRRRKQ